MKYKFCKHESRIFDFLYLPRLLHYKKETNQDDLIEKQEIICKDHEKNIKKIQEKLRSYSKEIDTFFYMKEMHNEYDLLALITRVYHYEGYQNELDYLTFLKTLTDSEIKKSIVQALLVNKEDDMISLDDVTDQLEEIISNDHSIKDFIKNLSIDAAFKWNLFLIIEEPKKYIHQFVELMERLHPFFMEIYTPYKEEIILYGTQLADKLNKDINKSLNEITFDTLSVNLFPDQKEINVYISVLFPYTVSLASNPDQKNIIVWGLHMEETFKKLNEINENKTNERVQIFKNLGDKTRYEVLKLIASGITSTKEIAEKLGVSSATISYHISNFITTKVVKMDSTTNKKFGYIIDYDLLEHVFNELKEDLKFPKE